MQEATIVERLRNRSSVHTVVNATEEAASLIERQQQVIDLLMKAVEPFAYEAEILDLQTRPSGEALIAIGELRMKHLRRAREAKVEAEKLLNSTPSTAL